MADINSLQPSDARAGDVALSSFAEKFSQVDLRHSLLRSALYIGRGFGFDENHALQVTMLAQIIFDSTVSLHKLSARDRDVLAVAAMLHDIGSSVGFRGHHKNSCSLIMKSEIPEFSRDDMLLAAIVARYHRKSEPKPEHEFYSQLSQHEQRRVVCLAAILRIADVLDRDHLQRVSGLLVHANELSVTLTQSGRTRAKIDIQAFEKKSHLFEKVFGRQVKIS
ncbi:MAG TPA: hypothetical protein DCG57_16010 [Candidatus Riflebacteria bacterium]|nr:hypothetical protein [Candidatus Riflebacteria bacterium]